MFKLLLVDTHVPRRALVEGALLGAVGFELLKLAANLLLAQTRGSPAFQAFGVALIVVVWINYFSRLVMFAAAWAYTSPRALERRTAESMRAPGAALTTHADDGPTALPPTGRLGRSDTMGA
jgi:membrane protein